MKARAKANAPDVPATSLVRKRGSLHPDAARLAYITMDPPVVGVDERSRCQVCGDGAGKPLAIACPVVDRSNGQRITIAICRACAERMVAVLEPPAAPAARVRGGRR